jgi:uncharacterized damage-inducible protein DinB
MVQVRKDCAMASRPGNSQEWIETYQRGEQMNQLVLAHLDPAAWRAHLPKTGTRTIAAIYTHVHNIRRKWIRLSAPHLALPEILNRADCTQRHAQAALLESANGCMAMMKYVLSHPEDARFHRDGWARPWGVGSDMVAYMLIHDAHHRGQVCMLANQLGFPLPRHVNSDLWAWEKFPKRS